MGVKKIKKQPSCAKIPTAASDASSNWKSMLVTMEKAKQQSAVQTSDKTGKKKKKRHRRKPSEVAASTSTSTTNISNKPAPKMDLWFEVDEDLLEDDIKPVRLNRKSLDEKAIPDSSQELTKVVAMDCEMVGVASSRESIVARVSIVNQFGKCVYDKFVKPTEKVTDYRTDVSGIRPEDVADGVELTVVQKEVADMIKGRILVGHAIHHDLRVLFLDHPRRKIRDTSAYRKFRRMCGGRTPSLRILSERLLAIKIQDGEHNSVQDAQATMSLYMMYKQDWEAELETERCKKKALKNKRKDK